MYRIKISNITEEHDENFAMFSEEELLISMSDWYYDSDENCYLDTTHTLTSIKHIIEGIKKRFPTFTIELFEYKLNIKPIVYIAGKRKASEPSDRHAIYPRSA